MDKNFLINLMFYLKSKLNSRILALLSKYMPNQIRRLLGEPWTTALISLTYSCQCRCNHCAVANFKNNQKKELDSNELFKLFDDCKKLGVTYIYFTGGEPLLRSDLINLIRYVRKKNLQVSLDTNGLLLDRKKAKELKLAGLGRVGISIDSSDSKTHDDFRKFEGAFLRAVDAIECCLEVNLECYISTIVTKDNLRNGDLENTIRLGEKLGVKVRLLSTILTGELLQSDDLLLSREEIDIFKKNLKTDRVFWENTFVDSKGKQFFCMFIIKRSFFISAYGDIQPCLFLPISFGNIRQDPLREIITKMWNAELFNDRVYNDCPMNEKGFREKYIRKLASQTFLPAKVEDILE